MPGPHCLINKGYFKKYFNIISHILKICSLMTRNLPYKICILKLATYFEITLIFKKENKKKKPLHLSQKST
jgi:hypothetical protein